MDVALAPPSGYYLPIVADESGNGFVSKEGGNMPTFVTLYRYTQQGVRNIKDSPARIEAAKKSAEAAGGKLNAIYVTMGQYDLVAITEWPSDEAAAAAVLAQGSLGNVTTETMRAFSEDEFKAIVAKLP